MALQTKAADNTQVSIVFNGGAGAVASIMSQVNSLVNDATGIVGGVVEDSTIVVGAIIGEVTSTLLNPGPGFAVMSSSTSPEPQDFSPQSHSALINSEFLDPICQNFLTFRSHVSCYSSKLKLFHCSLSCNGYDHNNSLLPRSDYCYLSCHRDLA